MAKNDIKKKFLQEIEEVSQNLNMQERQFNNSYIDLKMYIKNEKFNELINAFCVYTQDKTQELHCQILNKLIRIEICNRQKKIEEELNKLNYKDVPEWVGTLEIFKEEHNGIIGYIEDYVYTCTSTEIGLKYLYQLTVNELKEELTDSITGEDADKWFAYYDQFNDTDYNKAIEYVKIKINNENIYYLQREYERLKGIDAQYFLFDYENRKNIYASSFIDIMTTFDCTIVALVRELYPSISLPTIPKLSNLLKDIRIVYSDFFTVNSKDKYLELMESVARRNVYIHNKGIVNDKYLSFGTYVGIYSGWNSVGYQIGDLAKIDCFYFDYVYDLLESIISEI